MKSLSNLDIYVTGSNSKMLSPDILTEFRGRSDEIRVHPLSFAEYYSAVGGDKQEAFDNYAFYGGMPLILSRPTDAAEMNYLTLLFSEVYLRDIVERKKIKRKDVLSAILDLLCSSVGSLTNPTRIADTLNTKQKRSGESIVSINTATRDSATNTVASTHGDFNVPMQEEAAGSKWEKAGISNDLIFSYVMQNKNLFLALVQRICPELHVGAPYSELPDSYIIIIGSFDVFGKGRQRYS